ncbi:MAG: TIM barrel protein [Phycisphaerales bacterium]|nr:TIM barrel protein [Phycisphaerales bacterium]
MSSIDRREFLTASAATAAAVTSLSTAMARQPASAAAPAAPAGLKGRINHSACRWCYGGMPLDELCGNAAAMGLKSVELLNPDEWETARKHGLTCAVASFVKSNPIPKGFNRVENHDAIIRELEERLPQVKAAGIPAQIVFSGNRAGLDDAAGLKNCATGLKRITPLAEQLGITIVMELLNSKVDHKDYMCDRTPWGVNLVNEVGSPRFKLLYDIYHMQIMEGDVIRTITDHKDAIGHYHTGGNPGRREIDQSQELNYTAICKAIVATGYTGFIGQEFIPSRDPMTSLREAIAICDV